MCFGGGICGVDTSADGLNWGRSKILMGPEGVGNFFNCLSHSTSVPSVCPPSPVACMLHATGRGRTDIQPARLRSDERRERAKPTATDSSHSKTLSVTVSALKWSARPNAHPSMASQTIE